MTIRTLNEDGTVSVSTEDAPKFLAVPDDAALETELNRRLALGFNYDFGDERGIHHFGTTDEDMKRWMQEVTPMAQAAINLGNPGGMLQIKTDTGPLQLTAQEWFTVLLTSGTTWRQPLWQHYFLLKAADPRPLDFAEDAHWS